MRCLHCGNEVSLLHKLTDAQFCSTEHRQNFYDDQQRLLLQRLQASAARFKRHHRPAPVAEAPVPVVSVPAEAAAPAPIAAFCVQQTPEANTRDFALFMLGVLDAVGTHLSPPARTSRLAEGLVRLSAPVFDLPWARYNPGLLSFDAILPVSEFERIISRLALPAPIRDWVGLSASRLVAVRHPQALERPVCLASASLEPNWELLTGRPDLNSPKLRRAIVPPPFALSAIRGVGILPPQIANSKLFASLNAPTQLLVPPSTVSLDGLELDAGTRQRGMAFLDRVFRMRARSGILSKDIANYTPIGAQAEPCSAPDPLNSSARSLSIDIAVGLSRTDRFFRARPRGGVIPESVAAFTLIEPKVAAEESVQPPEIPVNTRSAGVTRVRSASTQASLAAAPALFGGPGHHDINPSRVADALVAPVKPGRTRSSQTHTFEPLIVDRVFRMRPRSGVADPNIAGLLITSEQAAFPAAPAVPGSPARHEFSPAQVRKFVHGRPRGPVPATTASFEHVSSGGFTELISKPIIAETIAAASEVSPKLVTRMFRPKLRNPLAPSGQTGQYQAGLPIDATAGAPAIITSPQTPVTSNEPLQVQRLFRYRLRGPVASDLCSEYNQVGENGIGFVSQCAYPKSAPAGGDLSPSISNRLIRVRPRSGVIAADLAGLSLSVSGFEPLVSAPEILGMRIAACAPEMVTKPLRMRPRAGVLSPRTAAFEPIRTETQALASRGVWPTIRTAAGRDLVVPAIDRIYRMRARAGVGGGAELIRIGVTPQEFPMRPASVYAAIADCAPALVVRICRGRPRGPVDVATSCFNIAAAPLAIELDLLRGGYPMGRGVDPSPAFMNRMYRVRPRLPLDDTRTQTASIRFKHLSAPDPEALFPTLPPSILDAPEPAQLEKLYRMRPKNGKQGAPANLAIECAPVTGTGAPDAYSSPAGAGAIAGMSARDALKSLSKNWKTAPADLKAMLMVLPLLVCLSLIPLGGKESSVAKASTVDTASLHNVVSTKFDSVERDIRARAAIAVEEDFGSGLDRWSGVDGWRDTWSVHPSGWVAPGKLAVLTPSVGLKDYRLEFSGQILSRGLGFVVRAANTSNYHAIKFKLSTKGRNVPTMTVVRTMVIDGKELVRKESTVPMPVTKDAIYPVTVDVNDQYFTLMIRDKVVDFWSDAQLKSGGIGFFTEKGEQALIHDVKVRHQYDALGRLVAAALPAER